MSYDVDRHGHVARHTVKLTARIVDSAQARAASEGGKFSAPYHHHAAIMLMNENDMATLGVKDGDRVECTIPEDATSIVHAVQASRHVPAGEAHVVASPLASWLIGKGTRNLELARTNRAPTTIEEAFENVVKG